MSKAEALIDRYMEDKYDKINKVPGQGKQGEHGASGDIKATPKSAKVGSKDGREPERSYDDL